MEVSRKRIRLLDILRGFAVLGTLGTNIWLFAYLGDLNYLFTLEHNEWWASLDDFIRLFVLFFVNGKLLGLLTIMFGVGLELKYQQSLRRQKAWPGVYLWTCAILLTEGLIHFIFVMEYDVLMSYSVTAVIVAFVVKRGSQAIKKVMLAAGSFHAAMIVLLWLGALYGNQLGAGLSLGSMGEVVKLYQEGSWLQQIHYRISHFLLLRGEAIFTIPMNIFLFLLGVMLMRSGAFSPDEQGQRIRRQLLKTGLTVGVPLNLLIFIPDGMFDLSVRYLFAPLMSLGYIGLIAWLVEKNKHFWLWSRLEQAGKMSLTCYVSQNLIASILFYGWGLGLGGKLGALAVVLIWLLISCFQLQFSSIWLKRFQLGPMETVRKYAESFAQR